MKSICTDTDGERKRGFTYGLNRGAARRSDERQRTAISAAFERHVQKQKAKFRHIEAGLDVLAVQLDQTEEAAQHLAAAPDSTGHELNTAASALIDLAASPSPSHPSPLQSDEQEESSSETDTDKPIGERFLEAAFQGQLGRMQRLVARGAEINAVNPETGESALHIATWNQYGDVVTYLLEQGADVQQRST